MTTTSRAAVGPAGVRAGLRDPVRWAVLFGLVAIGHLLILTWLDARLGSVAPPLPPRLEVAYVAELDPVAAPKPMAAPPAAQAPRRASSSAATSPPRPAAAVPPDAAASAALPDPAPTAATPDTMPGTASDRPSGTTPEPLLREPVAESKPGPVADAGPSASIPSPDGAGALPAADVALPPANEPGEAQPRPFEWPPSTRVSYVLTGHYRGEVHGFASVEWIRAGDRYQVHLEVMVGLPFAPILVRRMSSDGRIDPDGLVPLRYDETTRLALRPQRSLSMRFEREAVRLADGRWKATPIGVQDTASQFVQLAFVFSREPWRLAVGRSVEVPLALPRRVDAWTYDVMAEDWVFTPFGSVRALHLKPRPLADAADTLTAEVWFAPDLRYLPVRIVIHQDAETFIDLVIARKPEVAAN